jgi:hypothetical protein
MAEHNHAEQKKPQANPEQVKAELAQKVERQKKLLAELEDTHKKKPSAELELQLKRERDTLRHLKFVQKEKPLERAETKATYAAKAALSRAIQPVEK